MKSALKLTILLIVGIVLCAFMQSPVSAQDIHYSQFYASPLTLNPALTGKVAGDYRLGLIYRNQWRSITTPLFVTPSASFDLPFTVGASNKHALGAGILILNDQSNDGRFSAMQIMPSLSFHIGLGNKSKHQLSFGLQGGFTQKKLDTDGLIFASQYNSDLTLNENSNGESIAENTISYFDFNGGFLWSSAFSEDVTLFLGASLFHLFTPKEEFLQTSDNELPMRILSHAGAQIDFSEKISIYPGFLFMKQANAQEINFGNTFGFHVTKDASLFLGAWYRVKDAAIVQAGLAYQNLQIGFSYDFTTSDLKNARNHVGGFEISLIWIGIFPQAQGENTYLFCPRF